MAADITVNKNGTRQRYLDDGRLAYSCQYCGTWFIPGRRFVHKYCSESCRVMACRQRTETLRGVVGATVNTRDHTTNSQLANSLHDVRRDFKDMQQQLRDLVAVNTLETTKQLEKVLDALKTDVKGINDKQTFNIIISAIAPLITNYLKDLLSGDNQDATEELMNKINSIKAQINDIANKNGQSDLF